MFLTSELKSSPPLYNCRSFVSSTADAKSVCFALCIVLIYSVTALRAMGTQTGALSDNAK